MTPDTIEILQDEILADEKRSAERERLESQRCVDCQHSRWYGRYANTRAFIRRVGDPGGLGVCVIDDDPLSIIGIMMSDSAWSADCDCFEAVDK